MDVALFTMDGFLFLLRWLHVFFGVIWIGHLYYFNFVQGAFFAETDAATKSQAIQKLLPKALWWFRWGAMFTLITGLLLVTGRLHQGVPLASSWGVTILTGMALGIFMWANVWFIIWPAQKIVIASAVAVASGGQADPAAAGAAARALQASRTNTLFSLPMLFFMTAARNLNISIDLEKSFMPISLALTILIVSLEINAIKGRNFPSKTTPFQVIHYGILLTVVLYGLMEVLL